MRQKEGPSTTFQGPAAVCRTRTSHVYVFEGGGAGSEGSSEEEEPVAATGGQALRPRGKEHRKKAAPSVGQAGAGDMVLMQRPVAQEDSLYKLALQYGCQVADLKKVNSLVREQDLHGLRCVRIPVHSHGVLTEACHGLSPIPSPASETRVTFEDAPEPAAGVPGAPSPLTRFFRDIDQSIERAAQAEMVLDPTGCPLLPAPARGPTPSAHGGIRWWKAVLLLLLVGVVLPLFYLVYFKIQAAGEAPGSWNGTSAAHTGSGARTAGPGPTPWPEK
ncbi:lysM and putative peptidoglycan-binding domain-containing protein 4 [Sorex araneus]|uniref:lysM and putative peptidoglycan-binding domain-containing protein 4 n=1 Tax=Sorex araneus TaxID=42254 RepID=UPI002433A0CA|nr:lysM and putative peptidoglycan-binding domain-containing protein 4 [Sorex araneus]XP_054998011.1 lysM and putative peptidoglycan-binding domain-containing protein 4 [Sorex araneus]XP_054998012.1 lysM and putative peptidoglycan-binding domain-containing protein 4 [Sorex araneus]